MDDSHVSGLEGFGGGYQAAVGRVVAAGPAAAAGEPSGLDDTDGARHLRPVGNPKGNPRHEARMRLLGARCEEGGMDNGVGLGRGAVGDYHAGDDRIVTYSAVAPTIGHNGAPSVNGFWSDADWLGCRDGKWRPVEPGTFPLAHGTANRVGRLRGYGNAIVGPVAQGFIESVIELTR